MSTTYRGTYPDRRTAGRVLAESLSRYRGQDVLVVGLARGGVPVAAEVAAALGGRLDVAVIRKLGVPGHEELAFGAISRTHQVLNHRLVRALGITEAEVAEVVQREWRELTRREDAYRGDRPPPAVAGQTVILVDDGVATGASMKTAALDARAAGAARVVIAVPTAPTSARAEFASVADEFICPNTPQTFTAVGMSYVRFDQTGDDEVRALLART